MSKKIIFIILILLFLCCCASLLLGYIYFYPGLGGDPDTNVKTMDDYLGYELVDINISSNAEAAVQISSFVNNFKQLADVDAELSLSAVNEDPEAFFANYRQFNFLATSMISQAAALNYFFTQTSNEQEPVGQFPLLQVQALDRSSLLYYVPVLGALIQAKHESIEEARLGIWKSLNEMPSTDRTAKLAEYGLTYTSEVERASDTLVETLAKDPELRSGINWQKVSAELADNACSATSEGWAIGYFPNGLTRAGKYGAINAGVSEYVKWAKAQGAAPQKELVLIAEDTKERVNKIIAQMEADAWKDLKEQTMREVAAELKAMEQETLIAVTDDSATDSTQVNLPAGSWDSLLSYAGVVPLEIEALLVKAGEIASFQIEPAGYAVPRDIAAGLGFNVEIGYEQADDIPTTQTPVNHCQQNEIEDNWVASQVDDCKEAYTRCNANPTILADGYAACISRGGCWDIPRWEYIEEPACNNWKELYTPASQEYKDREPYCTCIDTCRARFSQPKDCTLEYNNCCNAITD